VPGRTSACAWQRAAIPGRSSAIRAARTRGRFLSPTLAVTLPNVAGACLLYFYFTRIDPAGPSRVGRLVDVGVFVAVTGTLVAANLLAARRYFGPLLASYRRLLAGGDGDAVPPAIRRRALNAPLASGVASFAAWVVAGLFYFAYQAWVSGGGLEAALRVSLGIVLVGGPLASALAFLVAEFSWRRRIPLFFPRGGLARVGGLRLPILVRLGATFLVTSVLPPLLMVMASFGLERRLGQPLPAELRAVWEGLVRTQIYIVGATGVASVVMAMLVARFINRPVQALRAAMAQVETGDLEARAPVRSLDELGELNEHFNAMVDELRRASRTRELFGRYVSPAVARQALERGIALGGELVRATAMFVDLRGFTALTERTSPARVVELLNEYYAIVERVCERAGGVITQFLGDGVVVVFGGPLRPLPDHARRAVRAAVDLQRALAARNVGDGEPLVAGIGICTGDIIAGNVGAGGRVTYTIVGDAVNQAARLQVKTRDLGAAILVTESTRAALGAADGFVLRPCGALPLKGIAAPVPTWAVAAGV
jgi:class 3 adenylate cyclase